MKTEMSFYDFFVPALPMGNYQIQASQSLFKDGKMISDRVLTGRQSFRVEGSFYHLEAEEILNVCPADKSSGDFDFLMPFVVLKDASFPWRRDVRNQEGKRIPWVALFLMKKEEILKEEPILVKEYISDDSVQELRSCVPNKQETLEMLDEGAFCETVTIPKELFLRILPDSSELPYLSHVRSVEDGEAETQFSVLLSNRIPRGESEGEAMNLFILSLEGVYEQLWNDPTLSRYETVRLLVLKKTEFFTHSDFAESFQAVASGLREADGTGGFLRHPDWEKGNATVRSWLKRGYVPITYHARTGEDSFGIIRSPLSCEHAKNSRHTTFMSADHGLLYSEKYGIFDFTYANAFERGRLLAFQDETLMKMLQELRKKGRALTDRILRYLKYCKMRGEQVKDGLANDYFLQSCIEASTGEDFKKIGKAIPVEQLSEEREFNWENSSVSEDELTDFLTKHGGELKTVLAQETDYLANRLEQLGSLTDFSYEDLVYEERFLPDESLRFFYLDCSWLEACFDGMISYGVDCRYQTVFQELIKDAVFEKAGWGRENITSGSGFFLKSVLALRWPNLVVEAEDQTGKALTVKRVKRLKNDIIMVLFDGVPFRIKLKEPPEGITMGFRDGKLSKDVLEQYWKDKELAVLTIGSDSTNGLAAWLAKDTGEKTSPAVFGFQLIRRLGELELRADGACE